MQSSELYFPGDVLGSKGEYQGGRGTFERGEDIVATIVGRMVVVDAPESEESEETEAPKPILMVFLSFFAFFCCFRKWLYSSCSLFL